MHGVGSRSQQGRKKHSDSHQVTLVEKKDKVFVPQVLSDVALKVEASGTHRVPGVKHLTKREGSSRVAMERKHECQMICLGMTWVFT
jgi:hypothetical protein